MTHPHAADPTPIDPGPELADLALEPRGGPTDTEVYQGDLEAFGGQVVPAFPAEVTSLEGLGSLELRDDETADPNVAAEEGRPWVPPIDPPVVADAAAQGGVRVAAGFGSTAHDEPFDADHHDTALPADDEVASRVREALIADARTTRIADLVDVETAGGVVVLRGRVEDIEDGDLLAEVASTVSGVSEVVDATEVEGL